MQWLARHFSKFFYACTVLLCTSLQAQTTDPNPPKLDHEWLVEVWSGVNRSQQRVETLTSSVEESAKLGVIDGVGHQALVGALKRERDRLESRRLDLYDALDVAFESYKNSPEPTFDQFQDAIDYYESIGKTRSADWLRDTLDLFQGQVQLAPIPPPLEKRYEDNYVAQVQQFLVTFMPAQVAIDDANGVWDQETADGVAQGILNLEISSFWNEGWNKKPAGVLTAELYEHLKRKHDEGLTLFADAPEARDQVRSVGFFLDSIWELKKQGVYTAQIEYQAEIPEQNLEFNEQAQKGEVSVFVGKAALVSLFNGWFDEWGDEFLDFARSRFEGSKAAKKAKYKELRERSKQLISSAWDQHPSVMMWTNIIGGMISWPAWVLGAVFIKASHPTKEQGYKIGFWVEMAEGVAIAAGEYSTLGYVDGPFMLFLISALTGLLVTGPIAMTYAAKQQ